MLNFRNFAIVLFVALATVAAGYAANWIGGGGFIFDTAATTKLVERLQQMALLTVVIERAVEVYLNVSRQNGPDRHSLVANPSATSARQPASITSLTLGILIAIAGVRILDTLGTLPTTTSTIAATIWKGVDVVLSGGLLAGGSFLIHEVTETISGTIKRVDPSAPKAPADAANVAAPNAVTPDALAQILAMAQAARPPSKANP